MSGQAGSPDDMFAPYPGAPDVETSPPEARPGLQGQGGARDRYTFTSPNHRTDIIPGTELGVTSARRSSTPIRARSLRAPTSSGCSAITASRSAWMGRAAGATTSSSSGSGARSSSRRSTCTAATRCRPPRPASGATSRSTTPAVRTPVSPTVRSDQAYFFPLPIPLLLFDAA